MSTGLPRALGKAYLRPHRLLLSSHLGSRRMGTGGWSCSGTQPHCWGRVLSFALGHSTGDKWGWRPSEAEELEPWGGLDCSQGQRKRDVGTLLL